MVKIITFGTRLNEYADDQKKLWNNIYMTRYSLLFTNLRGASLDNALFFCLFFQLIVISIRFETEHSSYDKSLN